MGCSPNKSWWRDQKKGTHNAKIAHTTEGHYVIWCVTEKENHVSSARDKHFPNSKFQNGSLHTVVKSSAVSWHSGPQLHPHFGIDMETSFKCVLCKSPTCESQQFGVIYQGHRCGVSVQRSHDKNLWNWPSPTAAVAMSRVKTGQFPDPILGKIPTVLSTL